MAWNPGDPIPEKGTPERNDYNDVRFADKATRFEIKNPRFGGEHRDLAELTDWEKNKRRAQKTGSMRAARAKEATEGLIKAVKSDAATSNDFSELYKPAPIPTRPYGPAVNRDVDVDPYPGYRPGPDNPNSINADTRAHDLMHNIGMKLDAHLQRLTATHPDVRSGKIKVNNDRATLADGFKSLNNSTDNHLGGKVKNAELHLTNAAKSFSAVAQSLRSKFGENAIPKVIFGTNPDGTPAAHHLEDLATNTSNKYGTSSLPGTGAMPNRTAELTNEKTDASAPDVEPILERRDLENNDPAAAQAVRKEENRLKRQAEAARKYRGNKRSTASEAKNNTRLWLANGQGVATEEVANEDVDKFHAAHLNGEITIPDMSKETAAKNVVGTEVGEDIVKEKDSTKEAETAAKEGTVDISGSSTVPRVNALTGNPILNPRERAAAREQAFKKLQEERAAKTVRVKGVTQYEKARELSRQGHTAEDIKSLMDLEHGGSEDLGESVERQDSPTPVENIERPRSAAIPRRELTRVNTELEDRQAARAASRNGAFGEANASARGE